jgi:hypothetical protein
MQHSHDYDAMARELHELGFDAEQGARYDFAFDAAQVAAVAVMCAMHDTDEIDLLEALRHSHNLGAQMAELVSRMEESPAFVGYIHSGLRF